jgi:hypothetical protein
MILAAVLAGTLSSTLSAAGTLPAASATRTMPCQIARGLMSTRTIGAATLKRALTVSKRPEGKMVDYPPPRSDLSVTNIVVIAFVVSTLTYCFWRGVGVLMGAFT